ncbi:hypothetical protein ZWY2020_013609 [Hordeum vulgare]|nr:hypothetical protein ZWY2020_013609 [Hordeum vulgare]
MDADEDGEVAAALAVLRDATRESAERRLALCTPRLLAALRRVLLIPRHASVRVDATTALVNLSLERANKVRTVRAGAVPTLVEVLAVVLRRGAKARPGALDWRSTRENRAIIGVLGAVPPCWTSDLHPPPCQRRDGHLPPLGRRQPACRRLPGHQGARRPSSRRAHAHPQALMVIATWRLLEGRASMDAASSWPFRHPPLPRRRAGGVVRDDLC